MHVNKRTLLLTYQHTIPLSQDVVNFNLTSHTGRLIQTLTGFRLLSNPNPILLLVRLVVVVVFVVIIVVEGIVVLDNITMNPINTDLSTIDP